MNTKDWLPVPVRAAGIERKLVRGETLFHLGSPTVGLYEIMHGKVRLARVDRFGREAVLYTATAGDTIAEASLFSRTYNCDAVAATSTVVRLYPKAVVLAEFSRDPEVARPFMAMLAHQIMDLRTRLELRNIRSARDRVRHYLDINVGLDGWTVELPGTLKDLAAELGLTHEVLYRTLSEMQHDGDIERLEGKIRIMRSL